MSDFFSFFAGVWNIRLDSEDVQWRGRKTLVGARLNSEDEVGLDLPDFLFWI